jgi:transcriptional regulator with XRE-family HTH domain
MKEQLLKLISYLGLTATKFADEIGVQRSSISHILSERNQPSYDFIKKVLIKYPKINAEWMLLGKEPMIKEDIPKRNIIEQELFSSTIQNTKSDPPITSNQKTFKNDITYVNSNEDTNVTYINKIILFHSDGTFDEYNPKK